MRSGQRGAGVTDGTSDSRCTASRRAGASVDRRGTRSCRSRGRRAAARGRCGNSRRPRGSLPRGAEAVRPAHGSSRRRAARPPRPARADDGSSRSRSGDDRGESPLWPRGRSRTSGSNQASEEPGSAKPRRALPLRGCPSARRGSSCTRCGPSSQTSPPRHGTRCNRASPRERAPHRDRLRKRRDLAARRPILWRGTTHTHAGRSRRETRAQTTDHAQTRRTRAGRGTRGRRHPPRARLRASREKLYHHELLRDMTSR